MLILLVHEIFMLDHKNKRYERKCKLHLILATIKFWPADLDCKKIGIQGSETFYSLMVLPFCKVTSRKST